MTRLLAWLLVAGSLALAPAAPGYGAPTAAVAAETTRPTVPSSALPQVTRVRFGSPGSISDAGVYPGEARGFLRAQGIEVEFVPFQSALDTVMPLASGEIEASPHVRANDR